MNTGSPPPPDNFAPAISSPSLPTAFRGGHVGAVQESLAALLLAASPRSCTALPALGHGINIFTACLTLLQPHLPPPPSQCSHECLAQLWVPTNMSPLPRSFPFPFSFFLFPVSCVHLHGCAHGVATWDDPSSTIIGG